MLNIHNLSVSFGGDYLFKEIAFRLNSGDRVGLIGKNGAGKSTLLKLLSKEMSPDSGTIAAEKDLKIGFLKQDIDFEKGRTILEEAYQAFVEIKQLEQQLDSINTQLAEKTDYESDNYNQLIIDLNDCTHRYEILGGYNYQGDTEKILLGLGFKREDFAKKTETFSGGWRMRIELAKLLLQNNDVLLLDEPTNHLDILSKEVLKKAVMEFDGTLIVVSHDRDFLKGLTTRTFEFRDKKLHEYLGDVNFFLEKRRLDNMRAVEMRSTEKATDKGGNTSPAELSHEDRKAKKKLERSVQNQERKIDSIEEKIAEVEKQMAVDGFYQSEESTSTIEKYKQLKTDLEKAMEAWESATEALEAFGG